MELDEPEALEYASVAYESGAADYPQLDEQPVMVASSRDQRVFSGKLDQDEDQSGAEDLDVPAFMRRGGL
jgi:hypothetical protein